MFSDKISLNTYSLNLFNLIKTNDKSLFNLLNIYKYHP